MVSIKWRDRAFIGFDLGREGRGRIRQLGGVWDIMQLRRVKPVPSAASSVWKECALRREAQQWGLAIREKKRNAAVQKIRVVTLAGLRDK